MVEINRELITHPFTQAAGNVAIAAEVTVYLTREHYHNHPPVATGLYRAVGAKGGVHHRGQGIGYHNFFKKTGNLSLLTPEISPSFVLMFIPSFISIPFCKLLSFLLPDEGKKM